MTDEKEYNLIFAKNLKHFLALNQMSQKAFAEKLGVAATTVTYWCRGEKTPRMDKINAICALFGIERSELLIDNEEKIKEDKHIISMYNSLNSLGKSYIKKQFEFALADKTYTAK